MEMENDDLDFLDNYDEEPEIDDTTLQNNYGDSSEEEQNDEEPQSAEEIIASLLESRGIEDASKIKFENEDGEIEEVNWNDLDNESKLNILNSSEIDDNTRLDDDEIDLINAIRQS